MPTITNPTVIPSLVNAYLINGRDKVGALIKTGYSKTYANNGKGARLFERDDVLAEIRRQELDIARKTGYTKEQAQIELEQARELATHLNQPSACVSAVTAKMRLHGMDQPEAKKDATVIVINPPTAPNKATTVPCEVIDSQVGISTNQPENGLNEATGVDNE